MGKYEELGTKIGKLVDEKNAAYGNSFSVVGDILRLHYPDGVKPEQYVDMLGLVRVFDKTMRIAHDQDALGESPWQDIGGYGILGAERATQEPPPRKVHIKVLDDWPDRHMVTTKMMPDPPGKTILHCKTCGERADVHGCGTYQTGAVNKDGTKSTRYVCCAPRENTKSKRTRYCSNCSDEKLEVRWPDIEAEAYYARLVCRKCDYHAELTLEEYKNWYQCCRKEEGK